MTDMILLVGAGLLCVAMILALSVIGVITARASRRRTLGRRHPGARLGTERAQGGDRAPFAERVIAPLGERMVGLGRELVRADTARKIQYRLNIAGNPPAWDVNRILGLKVLGLGVFTVLGFLYLLGQRLAPLQAGRRDRAGRALRLRAAQHPALQRRARSARS